MHQPLTHSASSQLDPAAEDQRTSSKRDYTAIALKYCDDILAGRIPACKQVKQACQRHLDDLKKASALDADGFFDPDRQWEYVYDAESASYACEYIEAFPHVKGKWAKKKEFFRLEPWEVFIVCCLFGWVEVADRTRYRFREAGVILPRKNGKSFLGASIGLLKFAGDGEYAAEVYFGATSEAQAKRLGFKVAKQMAKGATGFLDAFHVKVNTHNLAKEDGSILKAIIGKPGDGDSPSCSIVDEYHEHRTDELVDAMKTGMGARENPLQFIITTAGSNRGGPCFLFQRDVERVLAGTMVNDRLFGIVFTIDPEDDWQSDMALIKANPNCGVSVELQFLRDQQAEAIQSVRKQNIFKTKHLNIWVNASTQFIPAEKWAALATDEFTEEDLAGEECVIGLDLASEVDIASKVKIFRRDTAGQPHYFVFAKHYLNSQAVEEARGEHYQEWAAEGLLTVTGGNVTDYPAIKSDLVEDARTFSVRELAHDPYHAAPLVQFVEQDPEWDQSVELVKVNQNVANMSPAMKLLEKLVLDGRIHHTGDKALAWMIDNLKAKVISKDNIFPDKESPDRKIDGAVALMIALTRADSLTSGTMVAIDSIQEREDEQQQEDDYEEE